MQSPSTLEPLALKPRFGNRWSHSATAVATLAGLIPRDPPALTLQGGLFVLAGAAYLLLSTYGLHRTEDAGTRRALALYFAGTSLVFAWLLWRSQGQAWIAGMPLLSQIVLFGSLLRAAVAGVALLGALALLIQPVSAHVLFQTMGGIGAAIGFVLAFSVIARREIEWRLRSEELSARLQRANAQLETYAAEVAELSAERERTRLAREVHDGLGHYLTAIHVQLEAARALMTRDLTRSAEGMSRAQRLAHEGLEEVRQCVAWLRAPSKGLHSLSQVLADLSILDDPHAPRMRFEVRGTERTLPDSVQHALLRVAQEALTNVRRHAAARNIIMQLGFEAEAVLLSVRDDGIGSENPAGGFGLVGIRERVRLLGGRASFGNHPNGGFQLEVTVPA